MPPWPFGMLGTLGQTGLERYTDCTPERAILVLAFDAYASLPRVFAVERKIRRRKKTCTRQASFWYQTFSVPGT